MSVLITEDLIKKLCPTSNKDIVAATGNSLDMKPGAWLRVTEAP